MRRPSSVIPELFSRLNSATWAPTVERKTTFAGCAAAMAVLSAAIASCVRGNPGSGSKSGGVMRNTPSAPENAIVRPPASAIEAIATSQPFSPQGPTLVGIADNGPDRQAGREQRACNNASNLAGDSGDGIHGACRSLEERRGSRTAPDTTERSSASEELSPTKRVLAGEQDNHRWQPVRHRPFVRSDATAFVC